jgi:hypothetical protein
LPEVKKLKDGEKPIIPGRNPSSKTSEERGKVFPSPNKYHIYSL